MGGGTGSEGLPSGPGMGPTVDFFPLSTCEAHVTMCGPPVPFPGRSKGSVSLKSLLLSTARVSSRRIFLKNQKHKQIQNHNPLQFLRDRL